MFGAFAISRLLGASRRCFTSCVPTNRANARGPPPTFAGAQRR
jgi:hypothetical protein